MIKSFEDFVNESNNQETNERYTREDRKRDMEQEVEDLQTKLKKVTNSRERGIIQHQIKELTYRLEQGLYEMNEDNDKVHSPLVKKMVKLQDAFYKSLVKEIKKVYPPGNYSMGEDWYPGYGTDYEIANDLVNELIERGYLELEDPKNPEESLIKYK